MSSWADYQFDSSQFSGRVRLFPLPSAVLFPNVVQPLHIFEPRYRALLEDAAAGDKHIAMALLEPGWESEYERRPAIAPIVCLGRVLTHVQLDDGNYNLLLVGLQRARVLREVPEPKPYRVAEVKLLEDCYPAGGEALRSRIQKKLLDEFRRFVPTTETARQQFDQLLAQPLTLGMLTDIMAYTVPFEITFKRELLLELDVDRRAALLIEKLAHISPSAPSSEREPPEPSRQFPPDFSAN